MYTFYTKILYFLHILLYICVFLYTLAHKSVRNRLRA